MPLIALASPSSNMSIGSDPAQGSEKLLKIANILNGKVGEASAKKMSN